MNNQEFQKCKNDPAYFAEKYLGFELLEWQKAYLKLYAEGLLAKTVFIGTRSGKTMMRKVIEKHKKEFN